MKTPEEIKKDLLEIKALASGIATNAHDLTTDDPLYPQDHQNTARQVVANANAIVRTAGSLYRDQADALEKIYKALQKVSACYDDIEGFLDVIDDEHPSVTRRRKAMSKALDAAFLLYHPKK